MPADLKSSSAAQPQNFQLVNDLIGPAIISIPFIGTGFAVSGCIDKWAYSFFNPSFAGTFGTFGTFLGIGALAAPLIIIPSLITGYLLDKNPFWQRHPFIKRFLESSLGIIYAIGAVAVSAAIVGSPIIATMVPMLLLPVILWTLTNIANAVGGFIATLDEDISLVTTPMIAHR